MRRRHRKQLWGRGTVSPLARRLAPSFARREFLLCGDNFLTAPEECEDGNTLDGDGCSSTCVIEIAPGCGDGTLDVGEECDDGNLVDGDGCTMSCTAEFCGDDLVNDGGAEDCEPPDTATCTSLCTTRTPLCGDGFLTPAGGLRRWQRGQR